AAISAAGTNYRTRRRTFACSATTSFALTAGRSAPLARSALPSPSPRARPPFVDALVRALRGRLVELDTERALVLAALHALDAGPPTHSRSARRGMLDSRILTMIESHPGIRASM